MLNVQVAVRVAVLLTLTGTCACSIFPTTGPSSSDIRKGTQDPDSLPYALVRITPEVEKVLERKSSKMSRVLKTLSSRSRFTVALSV